MAAVNTTIFPKAPARRAPHSRISPATWEGIDDWLTLGDARPVAGLAAELVPTLGTDAFYELW